MRNFPVTILSAVDTASQTGAAFFVGQAVTGSFIPKFGDATAAGTVKIQGNNDKPVGDPDLFTPSTAGWADITGATSLVAAGVGPAIIIANMCFQYVRAVYTRTGGGTTTIVVGATFLNV